jgi:hypothetical protein
MGSTFPSIVESTKLDEGAPIAIQWRCWPLVDYRPWSAIVILGVFSVTALVAYTGASWLVATASGVGLTATLWQFFVPVGYELGSLGVKRTALGRTRLLPWHAVRAYQLRGTGVVLYQHAEPIKIDLLRSVFVPYPAEEEELICALRQHLSHAAELPP